MTNLPSSSPSEESNSGNLRRHISTSVETFQGPIPPPNVLEAYERLVPGAAERILKMAENQAAHRQIVAGNSMPDEA